MENGLLCYRGRCGALFRHMLRLGPRSPTAATVAATAAAATASFRIPIRHRRYRYNCVVPLLPVLPLLLHVLLLLLLLLLLLSRVCAGLDTHVAASQCCRRSCRCRRCRRCCRCCLLLLVLSAAVCRCRLQSDAVDCCLLQSAPGSWRQTTASPAAADRADGRLKRWAFTGSRCMPPPSPRSWQPDAAEISNDWASGGS